MLDVSTELHMLPKAPDFSAERTLSPVQDFVAEFSPAEGMDQDTCIYVANSICKTIIPK